jgi:hypothetical protein
MGGWRDHIAGPWVRDTEPPLESPAEAVFPAPAVPKPPRQYVCPRGDRWATWDDLIDMQIREERQARHERWRQEDERARKAKSKAMRLRLLYVEPEPEPPNPDRVYFAGEDVTGLFVPLSLSPRPEPEPKANREAWPVSLDPDRIQQTVYVPGLGRLAAGPEPDEPENGWGLTYGT